ncbi:hypothetical protein BDF19DRAFT_422224 [Syncephalis fuscata]|nr:hypothetical protein BDF19DRAFT_422224 [Syncephalis fuscata]
MTEASSKSQQDCVACRLTGGGAFAGIGGYLFWESRQLPRHLTARRNGLCLTGLGFIAAGLYRLMM